MDDQQQPQQPVAPDTVGQVSPQAPVVPQSGTVSKEFEPRPLGPTQEAPMMPTELAPVLDQEVAEAGVEVHNEHPVLTSADHKAGITHAPEILTHPTTPTGTVQLPMTPQNAAAVVKKDKNVKHSVVWLALLILKHLKAEKKEV